MLNLYGQKNDQLANNYISYTSTVRQILQQIWLMHAYKDLGLIPRSLKL